MNTALKHCLGIAGIVLAAQAAAQVTFYEGENFRGRAFTADRPVGNLERFGFNDRASSAIVERGRWEVCDDRRFQGRCVVLRRGNYPTLDSLGLGNRISSVRPIERSNYSEVAPPPVAPVYDYRVRPSERLFQANVVNVHAVVGPPERRCWVERERVGGDPNVGGAIVGGLIGGILGHQIGSGRGNDVATAGGAIAGAAVGANAGRDGGYDRNVQRCADTAAGGPPAYYDVEYDFRGQRHRVQMQTPPGPTITVNGNGEPRG
jgi:uncharacterized protein YcfJ